MTETDLRTHAAEIHEQFADRLEITVDEAGTVVEGAMGMEDGYPLMRIESVREA